MWSLTYFSTVGLQSTEVWLQTIHALWFQASPLRKYIEGSDWLYSSRSLMSILFLFECYWVGNIIGLDMPYGVLHFFYLPLSVPPLFVLNYRHISCEVWNIYVSFFFFYWKNICKLLCIDYICLVWI